MGTGRPARARPGKAGPRIVTDRIRAPTRIHPPHRHDRTHRPARRLARLGRRPLAARRLERHRGAPDGRPAGRRESQRPRLARRGHGAALCEIVARERAAAEPPRRRAEPQRQPVDARWPARHGPGDGLRGDGTGDRDGARTRHLRDGAAQFAPHRAHRPMGRAGSRGRAGVGALRECGEPTDRRAVRRPPRALRHEPVCRGDSGAGPRAAAARLRHQRDRHGQGAGGAQQGRQGACGRLARRPGTGRPTTPA